MISNRSRQSGDRRIAVFTLADGVVSMKVLDNDHIEALHKLKDGVPVYTLKRVVRPDEGQLYLDGLVEYLRNSTYYSLIESRVD